VRILQVNKLYTPWIGGVETVVQDIAEGMKQFPDVHCEVLVCRNRGRSTKSLVNDVPVTRVGSLGMLLSSPVAPLFPLRLRQMASAFDVVHVHVPFPLAMLCDWRAIRKLGAKLVIHYHSDIVRPVQRALFDRIRGLERTFLESADRIIPDSEGLLENSRTLAPYRDKCRVVPPSIDLSKIRGLSTAEIGAARSRYGLGSSDRIVLFAGRLVYYKGLQYLVEAVRDLEVKLLIAGEGPLRPALERQIAGLNIAGKVRILGRVTDAELGELYSLAHVFVLPSTEPSEAFGIVQLEAMAHGLPVVNTNLPTGVPSVSLHGVTGLTVPPADTAALRDAIHCMVSDEDLRNEFAVKARQRVVLFSRDAVLSRIRSIYDDVVANR
jgi:rhamnosyl/mannosyltransferase